MNDNIEEDNIENNNNNSGVSGATDLGDEDHVDNIENHQEEGSDQDPRPIKKKRYHRHTQHQIQTMEAFFKECPHPDDKQRKELSRQLGLDHLQIKFWFQNKRTQSKAHQERLENLQLRTENEKLRAENYCYREAITKAACPKCANQTAVCEMSFEEHQLRLDNARLQQEIDRLSPLAEKCIGKLVMSHPVMAPPALSIPPRAFQVGMGSIRRTEGHDVYGNGGNLSSRSITGSLSDGDQTRIIELAFGAMDELMRMAQASEPLWIEGDTNINGSSLALNFDEYRKTFRKGLWTKPIGFRTEASKETAVVVMNPINIVEMLMDVNQWSNMFAGIVARATAPEVLSAGDINEAIQVISAEFQVLSPLVSTREVAFARYCKKQGDGLWAVVDVSIDHILPNLETNCRRRPSGCLIQELQHGYSKVTWVEHVEVDDKEGVHSLFKHLVTSGQAFGANRWVSTFGRHCERLTSIMMATSFPSIENDAVISSNQAGKRGLLKLADRMTRSFFGGITTSTVDTWSALSSYSGDNVRVMTRTSSGDPGRPNGVILCAATTLWVPLPSNTVFDFLRDENNRTEWDVLCIGGNVEKMSQIANGRDTRNNVSLLRCTNLSARQNNIMMIQESSTDPSASFVLYAPVEEQEIEMVLNGGDSDCVALLPSGFAVLPDGTVEGGSLLTVSLQVLADSDPNGRLTVSSVAIIENLMTSTVTKMKAIFHCPAA